MTGQSETMEQDSLASTRWAGISVMVALSALLLTALFWRAEAVSPQVHQNYLLLLRELREADAEIDSEVLASRLELTRNYDALTVELTRATQVCERIGSVPDYLSPSNRAALAADVKELRALVNEKARLIETFKRANAVLRNSMAYFPTAADDVARRWSGQEMTRQAEHYAHLMLTYAHMPGPDGKAAVAEAATRLEKSAATPEQQTDVAHLMRHGRMIVASLAEVDEATRKALGFPTSQQVEALNRHYAAAYDEAARSAGHYRAALYALSLLLTAYLAYIFVRLDRTRHSLAQTNHELRMRQAAQTAAEERLRLHATAFDNAHEGMTLTDAEGNILEVNPAFTRITGYERSEVIGRNPRVLKSGRHDREFYEVMWKSIIETGTWRGEIWNRGKFGDVYPELLSISSIHDEAGKVTNYVAVFADITRIKEQEKQLTRMAYFDALTELPNRVLLADRIVQAAAQVKRSHTLMAVAYLDLDGFKEVNDTWGHEVGDQLLVEMAGRLKSFLRGGDTVARLGGDEFVLLLVGMAAVEECERAAQRLLQLISQPLLVAPRPVTLSASIGIAVFPVDDGDADTLVRHADQAMYRAKQSGKNCFLIFDPDQDRHTRTRFDRVARLQDALEHGEFVLHYQPIVDMRHGRVAGAEALIRWQHPERGLLAPIEFLPLIEDHDLMIRLGEWIIDSALKQMTAWRTVGLDIPVSINLAARQLQSPGFVQSLSEVLAQYPDSASRVELEVVESAALEDVVRVSRVIAECRKFGVSFALDDFGTGYSSLTYLKRLPVSTIKVDQSFVREILSDPNNLVIVQGVIGLAEAFQRRIIAEGVETAEHGRLLMQLGCDYAQGFGISRAMHGESLVDWARQWQPDPSWQKLAGLRWDATDYPMLVAEVNHRNWVSQIVYSVREGQPVPHRHIEDVRACRFGEWYFGIGERRYAGFELWRDVARHHERIHSIASEIDSRMRDGRTEQARALVEDILKEQAALQVVLQNLQLAVAITR